ncbi:FUSC family protein [Listeria costaricensis]|uniref:FUSC family protein n=1 Tax=Listeria costaricensis TaxID=2026604 RepID=UPI000C07793C|nr:FUSC family protein [Listeria costaricensis]
MSQSKWKKHLALDPRVLKVMISLTLAVLLFPVMGTYIVYPVYVFNAIYVTAQMTKGSSYHSGVERVAGTIIGCLLAAFLYLAFPEHHYVMIPIGAALAVLISYLFTKKFTMVIVVITVMVLVGKGDGEPFVFMKDRLLDTFIGLAIGFLVYFIFPKPRKEEVEHLFYHDAHHLLERIDGAYQLYMDEAISKELQAIWRELLALQTKRENILNDESFLPGSAAADPMFDLIYDLEHLLQHLDILEHLHERKDIQAYQELFDYHTEKYHMLEGKIKAAITENSAL